MIRCPSCKTVHESSLNGCPVCNFKPTVVSGFPTWAPELADDGSAYSLKYFARLAQLEHASFWFRGRNALIYWALKTYRPEVRSFLEIGCGTGFVISAISNHFPHSQMAGSEVSSVALQFAAARVARGDFMQMDARNMPFVGEFDAIGAFDVLEHIAEDQAVLENIHAALVPKGVLLITVPQHPSLWSESDTHWSHVRRYTGLEIEGKVRRAGFEIQRSTSFISLLLPIMFLSRLRGHDKGFDPFDELQLNPILNRLLETILNIERLMIKTGISFPIGGSRLIVASKSAL